MNTHARILDARTRIFTIAGLLGLLGPLPGYIVFAGKNFMVASDIKESVRLFAYFYAGAALLYFGWYCFVVGFLGSVFHEKLSTPGVPRSVRMISVVMLGIAAAVPTILLEGTATRGLGLAGVVSAAFWIGVYLLLVYRSND